MRYPGALRLPHGFYSDKAKMSLISASASASVVAAAVIVVAAAVAENEEEKYQKNDTPAVISSEA